MKLGVILPQLEIGTDPAAIRDYAQAAEEAGYDHILAFEHVLGADSSRYPGWNGPYDYRAQFHEPFVLYGFLAGQTRRIELVTGVLVLPQRQTALVAKQAAQVDVLSGGRLRLGVGVGWNQVEMEGLGCDFQSRGRRIVEQIRLLRALWSEDVVDFEGRWERVRHAGINPRPSRGTIPIWMGGMAEPVLRRAARLADGWFPQFRPDAEGRAAIARLQGYAREAGRDPASVGIEGRLNARGRDPDGWAELYARWKEMGVTHLTFNSMGCGYTSPGQHIEAIRRFKELAKD